MQINTLFILRNADEPLHVGDVIIAEGFQKYRITVKEVIKPTPLGDKVQWKIRGVREVIVEE